MSVTSLRAACLAASALVASSATASDRLADEAKRILNLADVSIQELELPDQPGVPALVDVELEGLPFTLDVRPHSVRSLGYQIYEDPGDGNLIVHSPSAIRTFRGEVLEDPGSTVAGSFLDDGLYAKVLLTSGDMYWIEPLVRHTNAADFGDHAVYHQDDVLSTPGLCASDRLAPINDPGIQNPPSEGPAGSSFLKIAELGCDADYQFFNGYGSVAGVQNRINLVINTMNTQYEDEVGIRHDISVIIVRTSPGGGGYTSNDPGTLLDQFRIEWTSNQAGQPRDVAHLFTGKNLAGNVIGVAWLGVICNKSFGYGLVQSNCCGSLACSTDLSAHELGHNWNANHCSCGSYTMNSGLTCSNRFHDTLTEPEIIAHRDSRNCLDDDIGGTVLFFDDFESQNFTAKGWTISSSKRCVVKKASKFSGQWGAKLKKGGVGTGACTVGTDETWIHTPSVSTVGFSSVEVLMHAHFRKNTIGCEQMDVQYSVGGGAWTTFASIDKHAWDEYNVLLPGAAAGVSDLRIRMITNSKGARERAEVDNFCIIAN